MPFKTVTTVVTDLGADLATLEAAIKVARQDQGHLDVLCLGIDHTQPGVYYAGANALTYQASLAEAQESALALEAGAKGILAKFDISSETRAITAQLPGIAQLVAQQTRFSDVIILTRPYGDGLGHEKETVLEAALFDARIPVLVIPDQCSLPDDIKRIVVGWDESREALRAVRCALPILQRAEMVNITLVDPAIHAPDRSDPGGGLSLMLARHGVQAEVSVLAKTLPRVSDVLARQVRDQGADMLVMGAYGHSRIRETILGGATRNTLQIAKHPVFMAH